MSMPLPSVIIIGNANCNTKYNEKFGDHIVSHRKLFLNFFNQNVKKQILKICYKVKHTFQLQG